MKVAIVTNCTSSGSLPVIPYLDGKTLGNGHTHTLLAREWNIRWKRAFVENPEGICATRQMYTGISFRTTLQILDVFDKDNIEHDLYIVSLGAGFVHEKQDIASYNLNIQPPEESPSSLYNVITGERFDPIRWWGAINRELYGVENPLGELISSKEYDYILVALSNGFLQLVSADIASVAATETFSRLRVLGPKGSNWMLKYMRHIAKHNVIMPISTRVNDYLPGNRNDFPARAALWFVTHILSPSNYTGNTDDHRFKVFELMRGDTRGEGIPVSDETKIIEIITALKAEGEDIISVTSAYTQVLAALGTTIKFERFERLWGIQNPIEATGDELEDALSIMDTLGIIGGHDNQSEVINTIKLFIKALKMRGGGKFAVADLVSWAKLYYDHRKQILPETLKSPNKLGRLISNISDDLTLIKSTSNIGGKTYEVR